MEKQHWVGWICWSIQQLFHLANVSLGNAKTKNTTHFLFEYWCLFFSQPKCKNGGKTCTASKGMGFIWLGNWWNDDEKFPFTVYQLFKATCSWEVQLGIKKVLWEFSEPRVQLTPKATYILWTLHFSLSKGLHLNYIMWRVLIQSENQWGNWVSTFHWIYTYLRATSFLF